MTGHSSSASNRPAASVMRREWRAPATDRTALVDPPWSQLPQLVHRNTRWFSEQPFRSDIDWMAWRAQARGELLEAALRYTSDLIGTTPSIGNGPLIVDGHQPELFHPGVWAKNFAIHRLARRCGGQALHLIVDNDVLSRTAIRVPVGTCASPQIVLEAFDHNTPALRPWEEARINDRGCFASFAERIAARMKPWGISPIAEFAWSAAREQLHRCDCLVTSLTAARVSIERRWGWQNLELPVSWLSATPSFHRFAALLFTRSQDVVETYNDVVREYRHVNHVRNKAHPVPDLTIDGEWYEMPFRLWRAGDVRRQRAYVRRAGSGWELRDETQVVANWADSLDVAIASLADLPSRGIRLRPRALTLTLFARLLLADLFVHGLGGAKYDEMTDALSARLFGAPPPPFVTVTATVRLPFRDEDCTGSFESIGAARDRIWQFEHNPQRFSDPRDPTTRRLVDEKFSLIAMPTPAERSARRERYRRLREINRELAGMLKSQREELVNALSAAEHRDHATRILRSREFSWVLFQEDTLRGFYDAAFTE